MTPEAVNAPFTRFWNALNDHLCSCGLPEIPYGPALDIWRRALSDAVAAARRAAYVGSKT